MAEKEVRVEGFTPSKNALKFVNRFPGIPLPGPLKKLVNPEKSVHGLCGGMCFAAIDHLKSAAPLPDTDEIPEPETPLYEYLHSRQMASWGRGNTEVMRYIKWMRMSDEHAQQSTFGSWVKLREKLEANELQVLGLIYNDLRESLRVWDNHQVLAYGYSKMKEGGVRVNIYDPNFANRDDVTISLTPLMNLEGHGMAAEQYVADRKVKDMHGFFLVPYVPPEE